MSTYSKELVCEAVGGKVHSFALPAPTAGLIDRLIIQQSSGADDGYSYTLFDRRGACADLGDLHVQGGEVISVTNAGGQARVLCGAAHNLQVGDTIEIKGSDQAAYNVTHTVLTVVNATAVITSVNYTADGAGGLWQTSPLLPTVNPAAHAVLGPTTVAGGAGGLSAVHAVQRCYANRDNQDATSRRRATSLYLSLTPGGAGPKNFTVSYTIAPDLDG